MRTIIVPSCMDDIKMSMLLRIDEQILAVNAIRDNDLDATEYHLDQALVYMQ